MVNNNIQGVIPLAGRGHTVRRLGGYESGEYKQLVNCELNENGHVVNRRNITPTGLNAITGPVTAIDRPRGFFGYRGSGVYAVGYNNQYLEDGEPDRTYNHEEYVPPRFNDFSRNPSDTTINVRALMDIQFYNGSYYWIYHRLEGSNFYYDLYRYGPGSLGARLLGPTNPAQLASKLNIVGSTTNQNMFCNSFIHKERLWIVTDTAIYFSKATDPWTWTVPDGGFFNFTTDKVNYALAIKDNIYVICDSSIYLLSYSIDPNRDSTIRKVSDSIGGDWACIYGDSIYFVKEDSLYVINGTNVQKVMDLNLGLFSDKDVSNKVVSFGDYIVILKTYKGSTFEAAYTAAPNTLTINHNMYKNVEGLSAITGEPSLFFINMQLGTVHAVDFTDQFDSVSNPGHVFDITVSSLDDSYNRQYLYLFTKSKNTSGSKFSVVNKGYVYVMPFTDVDSQMSTGEINASDFVFDNTGDLVELTHAVRIEISSFTPDGSEYFVKKFRSLFLEAKFPYGTSENPAFSLRVALDNEVYGDPIYLHHGEVDGRPPYPVRVPVNQRARSISLYFEHDRTVSEVSRIVDNNQDLLLSDIRLMWLYTGRAPEKRDQS